MATHDLYSMYSMKAIEYVIAVGYLLLFIPFWKFAQGSAKAAPERARAWKPADVSSWFELPDDVALHPGHAWARRANGTVELGVDDFGHKLLGPIGGLQLPRVGQTLRQGQPAWALVADGKPIDVLAPVAGVVTAVNQDALEDPASLHEDPYGRGWLVKVKPEGLGTDLKQLLRGATARAYLEQATQSLYARLTPELGALAADGGRPVHGFARELDPEGWDKLAREAFLSADEAERS